MAHRFQEASLAMCELFQKSELISKGPPERYRLITTRSNLNEDDSVRKWTFGERDINKENKIILMVGETGTGKTSLINSLVNYILGVKFTDHIWFEITDESEVIQTTNQMSDCLIGQTNKVTVYEVFVHDSPVSLTIIDTPGFEAANEIQFDEKIAENLYKLFNHETGVKEIDAVCLVVKASVNRLSDRQHYIFDAVLSLFGKDIENNIVICVTHSDGAPPTNAINAIEKERVPCRKDEENEPVYFLFNNRQAEKRNKKYERALKSAWELTEESCNNFLTSLNEHNRKSLEQTKRVLIEQERLKACIYNLHESIQYIEDKSKELEEIREKLRENKEKIMENKNFTFTVTTYNKEKVLIENASWWDQKATCCSVCEENCHEHNCWCAISPVWCYVMKNDHCTVCTQKCHHTKHVRENKKYITHSREEFMSFHELKRKYGDKQSAAENISFDSEAFQNTEKDLKSKMTVEEEYMSIENRLKEDLTAKNNEKIKLVEEAHSTIMKLCEIALKPDSFIVKSIDFLLPWAEESGKTELVQTLKSLKRTDTKSQEQGQSALRYFSKLKNVLTSGK